MRNERLASHLNCPRYNKHNIFKMLSGMYPYISKYLLTNGCSCDNIYCVRPSEIRRLRIRLNLSQQKFAEKLGVSITTVVRWENSIANPSPLALEKLLRLKRRQRES